MAGLSTEAPSSKKGFLGDAFGKLAQAVNGFQSFLPGMLTGGGDDDMFNDNAENEAISSHAPYENPSSSPTHSSPPKETPARGKPQPPPAEVRPRPAGVKKKPLRKSGMYHDHFRN